MTVLFEGVFTYNDLAAFTIEEAIRFHGALAGLHDFEFSDFINGLDSGDWTQTGSWTFPGDDTVDGPGSTGNILYTGTYEDAIPHDTVIDVTKNGNDGGIFFRATSDSEYYYFRWDSTHLGFGHAVGGVETDYCWVPRGYVMTHNIRVVVRDIAFSNDINDWFRFMSAWVDDALVLTYAVPFDWDEEAGNGLGLLSYSAAITYSNFRVQQLSEPVEWGLIDIGASPVSGLNRILDGRYVRWFVRETGELKAWRPQASTEVHDIPSTAMRGKKRQREFRQLASQVLQIGGWEEVRLFDPELYNTYGHRFLAKTNPVIGSQAETYQAAQRTMTEIKEDAERITFVISGNPILEANDHITADDGSDWIIEGVSHTIERGKFETQLSCRRYINAS